MMLQRKIMKGDGTICTIADLRLLVSAVETLPGDYEVLFSCNELDLEGAKTATIELIENTSSDGPGSVLITLEEPNSGLFSDEQEKSYEDYLRRGEIIAQRKESE